MNHLIYCVVLFVCSIIFGCYALSCRPENGHKFNDLKKIYNTCIKQQENNNIDNNHHTSEPDRRNRVQIRNRDNKITYKDDRSDNRKGNRDRSIDDTEERDRMDDRETDMYINNDNIGRRDRNNEINRTNNRNDRDRNTMTRFEREDQSNSRNNRLNGHDEFLQSEELDDESTKFNYYNVYNRRNKREWRVEMNSGQRSQYNPNTHKTNMTENSNDSKNVTNSNNIQNKACAMHCLMENSQMTGENGMPDRYLVTHAITKDINNEDLREFLQESIEECFQILDNENTEDKCEFSKNILLCLSEKGKANCDDWKDQFQF